MGFYFNWEITSSDHKDITMHSKNCRCSITFLHHAGLMKGEFRPLLSDNTLSCLFLYVLQYILPHSQGFSLIPTCCYFSQLTLQLFTKKKKTSYIYNLEKQMHNIQTPRQRDQAGSAKSWITVVKQPTGDLVVIAEECENVTRPALGSKSPSFLFWPISILTWQ